MGKLVIRRIASHVFLCDLSGRKINCDLQGRKLENFGWPTSRLTVTPVTLDLPERI